MELLPQPKGVCPECGFKHLPGEPHNPQTLYYQTKFLMEHKRSPTWADAMAHCSDGVKQHWIDKLEKLEIDINSTNLTGNFKTTEEVRQKLRV